MTKFKAGDLVREMARPAGRPMKFLQTSHFSFNHAICCWPDGTENPFRVPFDVLEPVPLPSSPYDEEKVERVARAICKKFDYSHDDDKQFWRENAKAALEAIRSTPS